jgi:hypothetical protein
MTSQRTFRSPPFARVMAALLVLGAAAMGGPVAAEGAASKLMMTVTVAKKASLEILSQPPALVVTEEDVARGYVEVASPAQLAVRSNSQSGYVLMFEHRGDFARETLVRGLSNDVQLGSGGGVVPQPAAGRGMSRTTLDLGFRFALSKAVTPGVHPWPLQVSVAPL